MLTRVKAILYPAHKRKSGKGICIVGYDRDPKIVDRVRDIADHKKRIHCLESETFDVLVIDQSRYEGPLGHIYIDIDDTLTYTVDNNGVHYFL